MTYEETIKNFIRYEFLARDAKDLGSDYMQSMYESILEEIIVLCMNAQSMGKENA